ncbi:MAG: YugN family protein [Paenibacillaceae bacterium]
MIPILSKLENHVEEFINLNHYFGEYAFTLGGNWDYDHGFFDRFLDEAHMVWLRIPFDVTSGTMDGISDASDAVVKLGTPFVLKHIYNDGLDSEAVPNVYGALINQFQEPIEKDAKIEAHWVEQAKQILQEVEHKFRH